MSFHATDAGFSARTIRLSIFRKHLMSSVCAGLIIAGAGPSAHAQQVPSKYFNADGTRTSDYEAAKRSWLADKEFQGNWGLKAIHAESAYAHGFSGKDIKLGIIDEGTYKYHPEFSKPGKLIPLITRAIRTMDDIHNPNDAASKKGMLLAIDGGMPFYGLKNIDNPLDGYEIKDHGTHTGAIVAAQQDYSDKGMLGVAWGSTLYASNGIGLGPSVGPIDALDPDIYAVEINQLIASGAIAINNSWSIDPATGRAPWPLPDVIHQYTTAKTRANLDTAERATKAGVILVFAAGNEARSHPSVLNGLPYFRPSPEIEKHFVTVANLQKNDDLSESSNICGYTKYWCLSAPGTDILSAVVTGDPDHLKSAYKEQSGTSMAAPHVTGALGLLAERYPFLTTAQIRDIMLTTARDLGATGVDSTFGWGALDLNKALNGPGQFLGRFEANLGLGKSGTWSNDISQDALNQRKLEDAGEIAKWNQEKGAKHLFASQTEAQSKTMIENQSSRAADLLKSLHGAISTGKFEKEVGAILENNVASALFSRFLKSYPSDAINFNTYLKWASNPKDQDAVLYAGKLSDGLAGFNHASLQTGIQTHPSEVVELFKSLQGAVATGKFEKELKAIRENDLANGLFSQFLKSYPSDAINFNTYLKWASNPNDNDAVTYAGKFGDGLTKFIAVDLQTAIEPQSAGALELLKSLQSAIAAHSFEKELKAVRENDRANGLFSRFLNQHTPESLTFSDILTRASGDDAEKAVRNRDRLKKGLVEFAETGLQTAIDPQSAAALELLRSLQSAIAAHSFEKELKAVRENDRANGLFSRFLNQHTPESLTFSDILTRASGDDAESAVRNKDRLVDGLAKLLSPSSFSISNADIEEAKRILQERITVGLSEYDFIEESRVPYLTKKLSDPSAYLGGLTKSGAGSLWLTGKNTYRGDTIVNGGELGISAGGSIVSASTINDTGLLTVDGRVASVTANSGGILKVKAPGVTGAVTLNGGFASVDGTSGATIVNADGTLAGVGTIDSLAVHADGTVSPGNSVGTLHVGTLHVDNDATFHAGSFYDVEIARTMDKSDKLLIGGKASLLGGTVLVGMEDSAAQLDEKETKALFGKGYDILRAGTITGQFAGLDQKVLFNYISPLLDYGQANTVYLRFDFTQTAKDEAARKLAEQLAAVKREQERLEQQGVDLAQVERAKGLVAVKQEADIEAERERVGARAEDTKKAAAAQREVERLEAALLTEKARTFFPFDAITHNQNSVWSGIRSQGMGNSLFNTVLFSKAGEIFDYDALSGEVHASLQAVLVEDSRFVRDAAANRIRAAFGNMAGGKTSAPVLAYGPDAKKGSKAAGEAFVPLLPAVPTTAFWGEAYGSRSHADGTSNASAYSRNTGGFVTGFDGVIADTWRFGLLAGYGNTSVNTARGHATADSYQVGVYGGTRLDALTLSLGTSLAHHQIDTRRKVVFGAINDSNTADYSANTVQLFGEAAYRIDTAYAALEPFAAAAYTHLKTDGFTETGGKTALSGQSDTTDLTTTTLGLRASHRFALSEGTVLTAHGMAGWRHAFGDTTPEASLAFASGGQAFPVHGLPIASDTALVEAGLDFGIGKATTLGLSYTGQFSSQSHDNAVKADLTVRF